MDSLVLVVSSRERSPDRLIQAVETIGEELAASPRVASVDYNLVRSGGRFVGEHFPAYLDSGGVARLSERLSPEGIRRQIRRNREALLSPLASPLDAEWISGDPLNLREIVRESLLRRTVAKGIDLSTGYYMDADRTVALLMVRPRGSSRDTAFVAGLYREVTGIAAKVSDGSGTDAGITVGLAGGYASAAEATGVIWRDMVISFASSFVLVLLLVYLAFRPPPAVLGVFVLTLFAALSWTLLFAYLMYGGLNIVTSIVAAMLIGLYVDYMILTYHRFHGEIRGGRSPLQALETTFSETGKALISSSATTSVAFFSVVVTSFRGLHELGVVAGFGILFCLLSSFLVMGSLLSWLAKVSPARIEAGRPGGVPTGWAERLVEGRSRNRRRGFFDLPLPGDPRIGANPVRRGDRGDRPRGQQGGAGPARDRGEIRKERGTALSRGARGRRPAARRGFRRPRSPGGAMEAGGDGGNVLFPGDAGAPSPFPEGVAEAPVRRRAAGAVRRCGSREGDPAGDGGAGDGSGGRPCGVCRGDRPRPRRGWGRRPARVGPLRRPPGDVFLSTGPAMRSPPT